jgi:hypothetical protein
MMELEGRPQVFCREIEASFLMPCGPRLGPWSRDHKQGKRRRRRRRKCKPSMLKRDATCVHHQQYHGLYRFVGQDADI